MLEAIARKDLHQVWLSYRTQPEPRMHALLLRKGWWPEPRQRRYWALYSSAKLRQAQELAAGQNTPATPNARPQKQAAATREQSTTRRQSSGRKALQAQAMPKEQPATAGPRTLYTLPSGKDEGYRVQTVLPLSMIRADPGRFQNCSTAYSAQSVERIVRDFDPAKLDPIVVWADPRDGKTYVLSGHSRHEALKRLGRSTAPVRYFEGTEAEAVRYSRAEANRLATRETLDEDINAYAYMRDEGATKKELAETFDNAARLELYTYLNPRGKFRELMQQGGEVVKQFPRFELVAAWVGELRKLYPQMTNLHEAEMFEYFSTLGKGTVIKKEEFYDLIQRKAGNMLFDGDAPLMLASRQLPTEGRADTAPAQRRIDEIDTGLRRIELALKGRPSPTQREVLLSEGQALMEEKKRLVRDINTVLKTQAALFGTRRH